MPPRHPSPSPFHSWKHRCVHVYMFCFFVPLIFSGKIQELLLPGILHSMTRLVLVNAIYFKGNWDKKFQEGATQEVDFRVNKVTAAVCPAAVQARSTSLCLNEPQRGPYGPDVTCDECDERHRLIALNSEEIAVHGALFTVLCFLAHRMTRGR